MTADLYVGLISGTSLDGIDAALVNFDEHCQVLATHQLAYPSDLKARLLEVCNPDQAFKVQTLGHLDAELGALFAQTCQQLIKRAGVPAQQITAIGCHGQTLAHYPEPPYGFSWQAGDANIIAEQTKIDVIADFRRRDIAAGGQGAPLVPAFHALCFSARDRHRAIVNIGGIANISYLPAAGEGKLLGFDCGPGNLLLDSWIRHHKGDEYDAAGTWAASGKIQKALLNKLLQEPFLQLAPPKSSGRELFNLGWLEHQMAELPSFNAEDVQATLTEYTATSIANAISSLVPRLTEVYVCGGGAHNRLLMQRLQSLLPKHQVTSTEKLGIHPDWVEAVAFAWLAKQHMQADAGNAPAVTGAEGYRVLGAHYPGRPNTE